MNKQNTLKAPITLVGKGLHTGLDITLTLQPAKENVGRIIRRVDLEGQPEIPALADYVCATERGTVLKKGEVQVSTIEHCMAALAAYNIDNCIMEVNAPEFPILDGSAIEYVEKIEEVGIEVQTLDADYFTVTEKIIYASKEGESRITLLPDDTYSLQALVGYDSCVLGNQFAVIDDMNTFKEELAGARTFVFVREIEPLLKANLIKGGDLNNAIVIYDQEMPQNELQQLADLMNQPCPQVEKLGYLNTDLKFNNEPARHKLLDVIGDMALIGKRIKGRIIAEHPGHTTNTKLAKQIRKSLKRQEVFPPAIIYGKEPVMDINQIKETLPHRYPFLLVDKVMEIGENTIVAVKNITFNEMQFLGHFPNEPVMPGVLQIEAMAQSAGILVLSHVEDPKAYSTYFLKINDVKFRKKVVPGDTMIMKVILTTPIRRGIATIKGYVFVDGVIATEAELTAQIAKNN